MEKHKLLDIIKASRKGSRDSDLQTSTGFVCTHKVHKSVKNYNRKTKHKKFLYLIGNCE